MAYRYKYMHPKHPARGKNKKLAAGALLALAALTVLIVAGIAAMQYFSADGFVEANVLYVSGDSIVIGNNCTAIVATTSSERAQSIQQGIDKVMNGRPNTHDTFAQVLRSFNITLDAVKFNGYDGKYYYSDMVLRGNSKVLALDAMPSDAIAIALRANATIYINSTLLARIGKSIC